MAKKQSHATGADRSSRDESQKPVETSVRHRAGHGQMLGSQKQESMVARPAETPRHKHQAVAMGGIIEAFSFLAQSSGVSRRFVPIPLVWIEARTWV